MVNGGSCLERWMLYTNISIRETRQGACDPIAFHLFHRFSQGIQGLRNIVHSLIQAR